MLPVKLVVSFKINDMRLFEDVASECTQYVASHEPDTLSYEWFISEDQKFGRLVEVYRSTDALEAHLSGDVFKRIGLKFNKSVSWQSIECFGVLPDLFFELLGDIDISRWNQLLQV